MKNTCRLIALLLCAIMMVGIFAGCAPKDPTNPTNDTNPTQGTEPTPTEPTPTEPVIKNWKDAYTDAQIADFYKAAIKIGYTEDFKYTAKGYTVGSGEYAEQVVYFFDLVHEKFPNAEFVKIEDQYDTDAIIAANCDIIFGLNTYALQALKAASALKEFAPEWAEEVGANLNDDDNMYFAIAKEMIISVYRNTETVTDSADTAKHQDKETFGGMDVTGLTNVTDLWKEGSAYIGKYELDAYLNDWNNLANKTLLVSLLSQYIDTTATDTDCVSAEGWALLQAMLDNSSKEWAEAETKKIVTNTGAYINNYSNTVIAIGAASNSIDKMAWYWAAGKAARLSVAEYGAVPCYVFGAAITATTTNVEAAQLFMDWVGTADVVAEMYKHVRSMIPANLNVYTAVSAKELDENGSGAEYKDYTAALDADGNKIVRIIPTRQYMENVAKIEAQNIDWDVVCQYVDAWVARANAMSGFVAE